MANLQKKKQRLFAAHDETALRPKLARHPECQDETRDVLASETEMLVEFLWGHLWGV